MKLLGENETEAVLQRLDRLNNEEARTTAAQTLEVVYGLMKRMKVVVDGAWRMPSMRFTGPERLSQRRQNISRRYSAGLRCVSFGVRIFRILTVWY